MEQTCFNRYFAAAAIALMASACGTSPTAPTSSSAVSSACISQIRLNQARVGRWTESCLSNNRSRSSALYYVFELSRTTEVQIDVESEIDSYVYLLRGDSPFGEIITRNDDGGIGLNARISPQLAPGTYTIEAATSGSARTGQFTVTLSSR
jgi:hypothetical protein